MSHNLTTSIDGLITNNGASSQIASAKAKKPSGRRAFEADCDILVEKYSSREPGRVVRGLSRWAGEDTIEFKLSMPDFGKRGCSLHLGFTDVEEYPIGHVVFAMSTEEDVPTTLECVLENVGSRPPLRAGELIAQLALELCGVDLDDETGPSVEQDPVDGRKTPMDLDSDDDAEAEDDIMADSESEEDGFFDMLDDDDDEIVQKHLDDTHIRKQLTDDFNVAAAYGFRPGFTSIGSHHFVVSVAIKVQSLGVPTSALLAWDSKLVESRNVYLVLLIDVGSKHPTVFELIDSNTGKYPFRYAVGLSTQYKPSKATIVKLFGKQRGPEATDEGDFESFSLSLPLKNLLSEHFAAILNTRRKHGCSWAAAEMQCTVLDQTTLGAEDFSHADAVEESLKEGYNLPEDPLLSPYTKENLPVVAFSYVVRRFVMCPRFCLVCHRSLEKADFVPHLKPYICDRSLCLFQFMNLGLGPSVEYEIITNPFAVDLLIQLAYTAAKENELHRFPNGIGIEPPTTPPPIQEEEVTNPDRPPYRLPYSFINPETLSTTNFDQMTEPDKRRTIAVLIDYIPSVADMRNWLMGRAPVSGAEVSSSPQDLRRRSLSQMANGKIPPSTWSILRWIITSNTSYIKPIEDPNELLQGVGNQYRQFRFVVGSPDKEQKLQDAIKGAIQRHPGIENYPTIWAFHGSPLHNWHSIICDGLHFRKTTHGRAYGHGVYFAFEGAVSMGYARAAMTSWPNSGNPALSCLALCEIVNAPSEFVSKSPYLVVDKPEWIVTRYLLVQGYNADGGGLQNAVAPTPSASTQAPSATDLIDLDSYTPTMFTPAKEVVPMIERDPKYNSLRLDQNQTTGTVQIPNVINRLDQMLSDENQDVVDSYAESDDEILRGEVVSAEVRAEREAVAKIVPWDPIPPELLEMVTLLPSPTTSAPMSLNRIQKEVKAMMNAQTRIGSRALGYYYDPELTGGNLFQWVVELFGFDESLPIAQDMAKYGVQSLIMEIRFFETYPFSPPFFRIIYPRFLPFIHGGGGHVTGGGSICMDLLTSDGWNSVYSIEAILMQIRLAISDPHPRPARLASNWNQPYTIAEAKIGFERAAKTHGWTVPREISGMELF